MLVNQPILVDLRDVFGTQRYNKNQVIAGFNLAS